MPEKKTRRPAQRIIRLQEVCDSCGGVDTFRVFIVIRKTRYVKCRVCGRTGVRVTVPRPRPAAALAHRVTGARMEEDG